MYPVMCGHGRKNTAYDLCARFATPVLAELLQLLPPNARRPEKLPGPGTVRGTPGHP